MMTTIFARFFCGIISITLFLITSTTITSIYVNSSSLLCCFLHGNNFIGLSLLITITRMFIIGQFFNYAFPLTHD
ncbi:hypothetical protein GLOIN_2v1644962 [Rhizophagus irregularis DAOM 181602=DAOM 197198]|uniref:Uncharacterized protein n=1 Tax=Rhizophagus irregularis (strain DAOM 181602 / DAOM 197198 / MUCL 43194) TaxID=747089 RepID=A0A2P4PQH3_RHIID|nr:hypothetical protein GLOIN_2v1644962 [Rhizophagus irregularis DAOM 181602=DAOM 197198]POG67645.1 hypothetical protein GLOIN_2v1644962 [Rhizophagus irregularis DAOM 181602=DAOM 197198]|eukprot:XP_025174511.1 hypothetical protein GLOIN_2v1644962 [Rhizophagus irregularis DAOM 181602=DAOM 197198]